MEKRLCSLPLNMVYTTLCLLSVSPLASTLVIQVPLEEDIEKTMSVLRVSSIQLRTNGFITRILPLGGDK